MKGGRTALNALHHPRPSERRWTDKTGHGLHVRRLRKEIYGPQLIESPATILKQLPIAREAGRAAGHIDQSFRVVGR